MNLMLLEKTDFIDEGVAEIGGRRFVHAMEILKMAERSGECKAGIVGGRIGRASLLAVDETHQTMRVRFEPLYSPPPALPLVLLCAMQRPLTFRKIIHAAVSMGVKELHFFHCRKVEKSYWSSPQVAPDAAMADALLALEQAVDTILPQIFFHDRFKPFVEDELPGIVAGKRWLAAHPSGTAPCPVDISTPAALTVGPEGGFTEYETGMLAEAGAELVTMGPRILRSEVAVPALIGRLFPGR